MKTAGRTCLAALLLFALGGSLQGQSAEDYFHQGANAWLDGKLGDALRITVLGLQQHRDDPKLNALLKKLQEEAEKQQQQNQQNQENQENQQQEQQQEQQQNQQQQEQQDQEQQEQEQQQQEQSSSGEEQNPQNGQQPEPEQQQALPDPEKISKEEAERILNALQKDEQNLQKARKRKGKAPRRSSRDW